jgi:hypothetical protein
MLCYAIYAVLCYAVLGASTFLTVWLSTGAGDPFSKPVFYVVLLIA